MSSPSHETLARFARELAEQRTEKDSLAHVVAFACETLGTHHAGVTLNRGARFETVGQTSTDVVLADEMQTKLREGPCLDAASSALVVTSDDLEHDDRWPRWGPRAAALGFRSILSTQLTSSGHRIGALNLYGGAPRTFSQQDVDVASWFALHASLALAATREIEHLQRALDSRLVLGLAQGMLMERFGLDEEASFGVLRRYSQESHVKLAEIARRVVAREAVP